VAVLRVDNQHHTYKEKVECDKAEHRAEEICCQVLQRGQSLIGVEHDRVVIPKGDQRGHHVGNGGDDKVCKVVIGLGILALYEIIERLEDVYNT